MPTYFECVRPECRFRFTTGVGKYTIPEKCPKCGAHTRVVEVPDYHYFRSSAPEQFPGPDVEVLLDNIRSAFNVGSIFRTADGAGIRHIHLLGITPPVSHASVQKTALGAEQSVPSTQHWNGMEAAREVKRQGMQLWALEGGEGAISIFDLAGTSTIEPVALVVGNEAAGIDPGILSLADKIISIPMMGIKESLNVCIACSIAVYTIRCLMIRKG